VRKTQAKPEPVKLPGDQSLSIEKIGVILVNLGTPAASDARSVGRYLREFLSDPRVVEIPRLFWWCLLNFFIVPLRSRKVSENYRSIWLDEGSPLKVITERQVAALQSVLENNSEREFITTYAMTYGDQSISNSVESLRQQGADKIVVLPLFPQYSASTTAAVYDQLADLIKDYRDIPDIRIVHHYYDHQGYIDALADSVRQHWQENGQAECTGSISLPGFVFTAVGFQFSIALWPSGVGETLY